MRTWTHIATSLAWLLLAACSTSAGGPPPAKAPPAARTQAPAPSATAAPTRGLPALAEGIEGVAVGTRGAVASVERHGSEVGLQVLQAGGNAVDAAVAVGFTLAVTHPSAGNIGGGGFMVVRMADGTAVAIDYRETAPAAASTNMYLDGEGKPTRESLVGPRAGGIPGTVAGLWLAHKRFGTRPWAELVGHATRLAQDGHVLDETHAQGLQKAVGRMKEAGFEASAVHYAAAGGALLQTGQRWQQPQLAATLQAIADGGADAFYKGPLATRMADAVKKLGGLWTPQDLAAYRAIEREPVRFDYRGHQILSMPPPSAGGVVLRQVLGAAELLGMHKHPYQSAESVHRYVEAARRSYADRNYLLGDPDFGELPMARLMDIEYIKQRIADVDPDKATSSEAIKGGGALAGESHQTTHYSVADQWGNAVANTYTLNTSFGSKVVIGDTGVLMNNEMDDFAAKPGEANVYGLVQGARNRIEPNKRMLSSMTPTVVLKDGQLRAIVGAMGGPTITTTVIQIVHAMLDHGHSIDAAVRAPRIHHQWKPDKVIVEGEVAQSTQAGLTAMGHQVMASRWGSIGRAHCIEVDPATGGFRAVGDVTRGGGAARAY